MCCGELADPNANHMDSCKSTLQHATEYCMRMIVPHPNAGTRYRAHGPHDTIHTHDYRYPLLYRTTIPTHWARGCHTPSHEGKGFDFTLMHRVLATCMLYISMFGALQEIPKRTGCCKDYFEGMIDTMFSSITHGYWRRFSKPGGQLSLSRCTTLCSDTDRPQHAQATVTIRSLQMHSSPHSGLRRRGWHAWRPLRHPWGRHSGRRWSPQPRR